MWSMNGNHSERQPEGCTPTGRSLTRKADSVSLCAACGVGILVCALLASCLRSRPDEREQRLEQLESRQRSNEATIQSLRSLIEAWTPRIDRLPPPQPEAELEEGKDEA
jgi:hypothetical protein